MATYGILFFATPHKGLIIDDIQSMMAGTQNYTRNILLQQIKHKSDLLISQLADFKNLIRDRKIVSFFEMEQTRRLELVGVIYQEEKINTYIYHRTQRLNHGDELGVMSQPLIPTLPLYNCLVRWKHRSLCTPTILRSLNLTAGTH
jgi:hypothetical protein